jgi:hypothetical protein
VSIQTLGPKGAIDRFDECVRVHGSAELPNFRPLNAGWLLQYPAKYTIHAKGSDKTEIPIQGSSKMSHQKPSRCLFVPIVILLLVLGMTFGMVWHHHADSSATTCPICHLVIVPLAAGIHVWWVPVPTGTVSEAIYMEPVARSVPRLPARAPPA